MEQIFPELLIKLLTISVTFSFILMILIQKFKTLRCINHSWIIWILNLIFSFSVGIPFSLHFYNTSIKDSIWVGFFSFIGAASIYQALKNQTILNYKPTAIEDEEIKIKKENEIKRDDV